MNFEMQKAIMLAEHINAFIKLVQKYRENNSFRLNTDRLYQVRLLIEEYKFQLLADELWRINQFDWDEMYTNILVDDFVKGINVIDEYVNRNSNDLFLLKPKLYTLKSLSLSFSKEVTTKGESKMVNLALLGAWHVHTKGFLEDALKTGMAELKVVWDDDVSRGKAIAKEFGVPFEKNLEKVLNREDVEAVMVECATTLHKEVIVKAANAKKHIFSDKALALTVDDCLEIKQAIEENQVKFMVSLESKTIGAYRYAKQLVDEGKLGRVTAVYFRRAHQAALDPNMLPAYWFDKEQTGGGVTLDLGCHGLYLLPYFCGTPKKVSCLMNELFGTGSDENSTTIIEFEDGAIATAHTSFVAYRLDNMLEIIGTEGSLLITGTDTSNFRVLLQSKHVPGHEDLMLFSNENILADDEPPSAQFVRLVSSDTVESLPDFDIDAAINLTRLIECAYKSARDGSTVLYDSCHEI